MGLLPPGRLLLIAAAVCMGGPFHHGFQAVVTSPAQAAFMAFVNSSHYEHYGWNLSKALAQTVWSITVAALSIGAIFGALSLNITASKLGRKRGLFMAVGIEILGSLLAVVSYHALSFELYIVSRIVLGYSITIGNGLAAILLNESSPKRCRGFISMMSCQTATLGTVCAAVIAMPKALGTVSNWWYIYLFETITLVPVVFVVIFIHESPGYLLANGNEDDALKSIQFYHRCKLDDAKIVLEEIRTNLKLLAKTMKLSAIYNDKHSRNGVLVGVVVACSMSFSGASAVNAFAVGLLIDVGLSRENASYANIGLMALLFVFATMSSFLVDRYGRRPLILISLIGLIITNAIIAVLMYCYDKYQSFVVGYLMVAVIALTKLFTASGIAPLSFFIASEMVGQAVRSFSQTCSTTALMIIRTITVASFLPLSEAVGRSIAFIILFVIPLIFGVIYLYFNMPETKNRYYREVVESMDRLPSISKCFRWRTYHSSVVFASKNRMKDCHKFAITG